MAVFGYGRVSTKGQTTENQLHEIRAAGYQVETEFWYAEEGVSGKVPALQRPEFIKLLGQIRLGEVLVVTKLDRLGRDAQDVSATIKMLAARDTCCKAIGAPAGIELIRLGAEIYCQQLTVKGIYVLLTLKQYAAALESPTHCHYLVHIRGSGQAHSAWCTPSWS